MDQQVDDGIPEIWKIYNHEGLSSMFFIHL